MMLVDCLQRRDLEILRTLARLRYMTTKEIVTGFFATPTVGRRRIRRLSGLDLIASHREGASVKQLAGGALKVFACRPRAPLFGVRRAGDRVDDRRLRVARLDIPGRVSGTSGPTRHSRGWRCRSVRAWFAAGRPAIGYAVACVCNLAYFRGMRMNGRLAACDAAQTIAHPSKSSPWSAGRRRRTRLWK